MKQLNLSPTKSETSVRDPWLEGLGLWHISTNTVATTDTTKAAPTTRMCGRLFDFGIGTTSITLTKFFTKKLY